MASRYVEAYRVTKGNRIFVDQTRFSAPVRTIDENANAGTVRFVFEDNTDLTVYFGDEVVIK